MKKKTLLILLIIPFIISLFTFVGVSILVNSISVDIADISWNYRENEGFKLSSTPYKLEAKAIYDPRLELNEGNDLIWKVEDEKVASITKIDNEYYLSTHKEGSTLITCLNEKGTISKHFNAYIYVDSLIVINLDLPSSMMNVDPTRYIGQYDLFYKDLDDENVNKKATILSFDANEVSDNKDVYLTPLTSNIKKINNNQIEINGFGLARLKFYINEPPFISNEYSFYIVENGYNIYNYNDLLMSTNFSKDNKKIVLQTNFESINNLYQKDNSGRYINTKIESKEDYQLFGNFDFNTQSFNFNNEIVSIKSTFNTKFIAQYNEVIPNSLEPNILVGLNIKDDIYGNGFTINGNDLTFPNHGKISLNGKLTPEKGKDYFFGPLPFITIGDIKEEPIVKVYGQDNALIYLNGDDIVINDIKVKNCNDVDNMYNLLYTGSVIDVNGHNNLIKNSILSNGRTIVRAFSSNGLTISNSILKNAAQFLLSAGSNEYLFYELDKEININYNNQLYSDSMSKLFDLSNKEGVDYIINSILKKSDYSNIDELNNAYNALKDIQNGLDNIDGLYDKDKLIYKDTINLNKVYFASSGIFSIGLETLFNGPYLYNGIPTGAHQLLNMFDTILPNQIGGTSLPIQINIDSKTKFYDWKKIDSIDTSILIEENVSSIIEQLSNETLNLTMEDYFPMKQSLKEEVRNNNRHYIYENEEYINSKVAYYGGGLNLSKINIENENINPLNVDIARNIISNKFLKQNDYVYALAKCVLLASGVHPFKFLTNEEINGTPTDFNKIPQIEDLYK